MTYGELAERMGYADRRAGHMLSRQLGIIGEFCRLNDLPALNSVVVNQRLAFPVKTLCFATVELLSRNRGMS